jgi:hypothetical protein
MTVVCEQAARILDVKAAYLLWLVVKALTRLQIREHKYNPHHLWNTIP